MRDYNAKFDRSADKLGYFDALTRFTRPLTSPGWPILRPPTGPDQNDLFIGERIVGKPGSEARLPGIAQELARAHKFQIARKALEAV